MNDNNFNIESIKKILYKYDSISNALLFGSYASQTQTPMSDVDIAIYTTKELTLLELGAIVSDLDALVHKKIDLVVLNALPQQSPLLAFNIYKNHQVLFLKDKKQHLNFKERALHSYLDFAPVIEAQNRAFIQSIKGSDPIS